MGCILLALVSLAKAQAWEVWQEQSKLTHDQILDLLVKAIKNEKAEAPPLEGIEFREFNNCDDFYSLVRKADAKRLEKSLKDPQQAKSELSINFDGAIFKKVAICWLVMPGSTFKQAKFTDVLFQGVTLTKANFEHSEAHDLWFVQCAMKEASFNGEPLSTATPVPKKISEKALPTPTPAPKKPLERRSKEPSEIHFWECDLEKCDFRYSWLKNATFFRSSLSDSDLSWAKFESIIYDPLSANLPFLPSFASLEGISSFRYQTSPFAMTELRNAFKNAGLRREERQITAALNRQQMEESSNWFEREFKRIFFDLPCAFGMSPGRPLRILLFLCVICAVPYTWAIVRQAPQTGGKEARTRESWIWQVPLEKRVASGDSKPTILHVDIRSVGVLRGLTWALLLGFFFSVISAGGVGYRDLDVGRWIERIKREETTLKATGWLRTLSGFQSLTSVYLLALWLVTYFGRPFE